MFFAKKRIVASSGRRCANLQDSKQCASKRN